MHIWSVTPLHPWFAAGAVCNLWQPGVLLQRVAFPKAVSWQNSPVVSTCFSRFVTNSLRCYHGVSQWQPVTAGCDQHSSESSPEVSGSRGGPKVTREMCAVRSSCRS